ncbi:DNA mismatch repair protein MutS [bacterium]|nr:DNA mismatch repair protein MutS [bacterium]
MSKSQQNPRSETPLMTQYNAIKAKNRDAILFFRMGDFYEMFNEDAKTGARVLGITLTSRGHGKAEDVPLAGFPHHALDGYLAKMLKAGYRVAICEQIEDPKLAKGIVKRDVIQIATPGTVMDDKLLQAGRNNFLAGIHCENGMCGVAAADMSTGEFQISEVPRTKLLESLQAVGPSEILVPESLKDEIKLLFQSMPWKPVFTSRDNWLFQKNYGYDVLIRHFKTSSLKGFGCEEMHAGLGAAGAVLSYLEETQKTDLSHIRSIRHYADEEYMVLDAATRRNLEITASMISGDREGTLLSILDRTRTAMGARTLAAWIQRPLRQLVPIRGRLDAVEEMLGDGTVREQLAGQLKGMGDLERLITKVVTRRAGPRDVQALQRALMRIPALKKVLGELSSDLTAALDTQLDPCEAVVKRIGDALAEDPPASAGDGGLIRDGYSKELDELRKLTSSGKDWIAGLQRTERERAGIPSLKVGFNKVFGYYIEVTNPHLSKVPETYIRKQTLVNAERFITPELKEMEEKVLHAEERMTALELSLFDELRFFVSEHAEPVQVNGHAVGTLDALCSLAETAETCRYVKPDISDDYGLFIQEGRHPVVEQLLPPGDPFIPNDLEMDEESQIHIVTGPNMAGKSTYIRQAGLIVLMAHIGSYVPAAKARIGLADRIFTRVGAQDNLAAGESTFLVEMNETANILNNATEKSLILLDEIGRGTSTFDGLSIAWAVAEYLHKEPRVRAKTLFATHYHELTELALMLPRVRNYNVAVKEWGDHIVFLRKIVPGGCDHSYGIQVARLAGLPLEIIGRAKEILHNLEANELTPNEVPKLAVSPGLMQVAQPQLDMFRQEELKLRDAILNMNLERMTPLEALQKLDELRKMIGDN